MLPANPQPPPAAKDQSRIVTRRGQGGDQLVTIEEAARESLLARLSHEHGIHMVTETVEHRPQRDRHRNGALPPPRLRR